MPFSLPVCTPTTSCMSLYELPVALHSPKQAIVLRKCPSPSAPQFPQGGALPVHNTFTGFWLRCLFKSTWGSERGRESDYPEYSLPDLSLHSDCCKINHTCGGRTHTHTHTGLFMMTGRFCFPPPEFSCVCSLYGCCPRAQSLATSTGSV